MEAQRFIDRGHEVRRESAYCRAHPLNGYGPHLLGLGFGISPQSCLVCGQQHLKGKDPLHVAGDWYDGHYSATESMGRGVGPVIADQHRWPTLVGLTTTHGVQVDEKDLTAQHR